MGIGISVEGLTKSFGSQRIWGNDTFDLPAGEVSVLLGPSGTGKSVFLKSLIGLLRPERGEIVVDSTNIIECSAKELYEIRTLFGVMSLYDNTAFPLREHTKKKESEIRNIVMEKLELVGLGGDENKFPGEISGGMRKRAGLARSLVLDPQIILCDEPDSGLDPVRTAYLSQLLIDINAQIDCTILIVTHNINIARTVPDNMGMLFRKHLVMFGPREVLLTSDEPVVKQFLNGRRIGPIGMSEEKDDSTMAGEPRARDPAHAATRRAGSHRRRPRNRHRPAATAPLTRRRPSQSPPPTRKGGSMNRAEEATLAWSLVDAAKAVLSPEAHTSICLQVGVGDQVEAIDELLRILAARRVELPEELRAPLWDRLAGYRGSDPEPAFHVLMARSRVPEQPRPPEPQPTAGQGPFEKRPRRVRHGTVWTPSQARTARIEHTGLAHWLRDNDFHRNVVANGASSHAVSNEPHEFAHHQPGEWRR